MIGRIKRLKISPAARNKYIAREKEEKSTSELLSAIFYNLANAETDSLYPAIFTYLCTTKIYRNLLRTIYLYIIFQQLIKFGETYNLEILIIVHAYSTFFYTISIYTDMILL